MRRFLSFHYEILKLTNIRLQREENKRSSKLLLLRCPEHRKIDAAYFKVAARRKSFSLISDKKKIRRAEIFS